MKHTYVPAVRDCMHTDMKSFMLLSSYSPSCVLWFLAVLALCFSCYLCDESSNHVLCIKSERAALLQFKTDLIDGANRLSSWSGNNKDCCKWVGVVCNNVTGHIQELHLGGPNDGLHGHCHGSYDTDDELEAASKQMLGGNLNPSLISLKQLSYLDLSCNDFGGIPIPVFIASLRNLRYLNLSTSQFDGQIPPQLGNLTMLRVLDLRYGLWGSSFTVKSLQWLTNLHALQHLDLSGYDLSAELNWLQVMTSFPSLFELRLSSCSLSQIPRHLNTLNFTSLLTLDLSYNSFDSSLMPGWIFNLTSLVSIDLTNCFFHDLVPGVHPNLQRFTSLRILHVSSNDFMNHSSVLKGVYSLGNLVSLDMSTCGLRSPILHELQNMSSLVSLDLSNNRIVEEVPTSLANLCNLRFISLQSNLLFGSVSELLQNFSECKTSKLESLGFWGNNLVGSVPNNLGYLKNLITFDLGFNFISGQIPDSIGSLPNLEMLVLNANSISGRIPNSIGRLSSLEWLDLSNNQLTTSLPESLGNLKKLTFFSVYNNLLNGSVTTHHFANLTALKTLRAENNKLILHPNVRKFPPFQLGVLRIGSWDLGPRFPSWLQFQRNLTELDISNANISDIMPEWFWSTFSTIEFLNTSHNRILGKLPHDLSFLSMNAVVDLSDNGFHGSLPASFNRPDLPFLDLSTNHLSGSLYQFLCPRTPESRQLKVLNLANNELSGVIPDCWGNWDSLELLNFENNRLSGGIPKSVGEISSLRSLNIRKNNLSGILPLSVMSSNSLLIIDLADNKLTGFTLTTPNRSKASKLILLSLRSNRLSGKFPNELCGFTSIQILDLAGNNLSGSIPTCLYNFSIMSGKESSGPIILYDEFDKNQVVGSASLVTKGRESSYSTILNLVTTLDLSGNLFSGHIPNQLMNLVGLRYLNLSRNQLTGRIPENIGEMQLLESLDLSSNMLQGQIPSSISNLTFLNWLNVSYNRLTGRIPTSTQIQSFDESSFIGNRLCGTPLPEVCGSATHVNATEGEENTDEDDEVDWVLIVCLVVGFCIGFWIAVGPLVVNKVWRNTYFGFLHKAWSKLCDKLKHI